VVLVPTERFAWWWVIVAAAISVGLWLLLKARDEGRTPAPLPPPTPPPPTPPVQVSPPAPLPEVPVPVAVQPAVAVPWQDPLSQPLPETRLVVVRAPDGVTLPPYVRITRSEFTVGAREGVDFRVDGPTMSGRHATFQLYPTGNLFVVDEGSTNGTTLEGRRLAKGERTQVQHGQRVLLSQALELRVEQPGREQAAAAGVPSAPPETRAPSAPDPDRTKNRTIYAPVRGRDDKP
jgi:hypothetical protein